MTVITSGTACQIQYLCFLSSVVSLDITG